MERERCLALVRGLTEQVVAAVRPEKLPDFADDFADFVLTAGAQQAAERQGYLVAPGQGLETTLVAGMFFEVLLDAARLPLSAGERVSFVRKKAKDYLVTRLAGQITLSQFYRLLNLIEARVGDYFEHLAADWTGAPQALAEVRPPEAEAVNGEALRKAIARLSLSLKGRRKLTPETLWDFLRLTGGRWFKLLDFEARFQVNKKTAWSYLNLLLSEGVLEHNGEKANRVRYALAPAFRIEPAPLIPHYPAAINEIPAIQPGLLLQAGLNTDMDLGGWGHVGRGRGRRSRCVRPLFLPATNNHKANCQPALKRWLAGA